MRRLIPWTTALDLQGDPLQSSSLDGINENFKAASPNVNLENANSCPWGALHKHKN